MFSLVDRYGELIAGEENGLLLYNGGTVCDDFFNDNSADAVCRDMGYVGSNSWNSYSNIIWSIQADYDIKLFNFKCDGSGQLASCTYSTKYRLCSHIEDVFLSCYNGTC